MARWIRELSASCKEGSLEPGGQQGRPSPPSSKAEPPAADAKGHQRGVERPSGVWSPAVSAVPWSQPPLCLESGALHASGSRGECLGPPGGKYSAETPVLVTCADIMGVSPCQMCLV